MGTVSVRTAVTSPPALRRGKRPARPRTRPHVPVPVLVLGAGVTCALVASAWSGQLDASAVGLPDAGAVTGWLLPVARIGSLLLAVGTIGVLSLRLLVLGPDAPARSVGACRRWAWGWAGGIAAWTVLTVSDVSGVPVWDVPQRVSQWSDLLAVDLVRAQLAALVLACAVAVVGTSTSVPVLRGAAALAGTAVVLPFLVNHLGHDQRGVALASVSVHALAAAVWTGSLLAVVAYLRRHRALMVRAVPRLSALSLVCASLVLLSGLVTAYAAQVSVADLDTAYGRFLLAKAFLLTLLLVAGALHRRYTVPAVSAGSTRALVRLGVVELALLGTTFGIASVLAVTVPPWS